MQTTKIPNKLYKNLNQLAFDSGFKNVHGFVNFVLEEVVKCAYGGKEEELTNDKERENHLIELIHNNPDDKGNYVTLFNYYLTQGDNLNAGDMKMKILNRFH